MLWHALAVFCLALHCSFLTCFYFPRMPARPVQQIPCPILTKHMCVCIKHAHVCSSHDLLTGSSNETMCPLRGQMIALSCCPRPSSSLPTNNTHVGSAAPCQIHNYPAFHWHQRHQVEVWKTKNQQVYDATTHLLGGSLTVQLALIFLAASCFHSLYEDQRRYAGAD